MIIEGAFLKLPELLLGHMFPKEQYEATLLNYLAMGVLLELSARSIELPMHRIHLERPYPEVSGHVTGRADLYVNLGGTSGHGLGHNLYGMKPDNWIEAKFFGGIGRQAGTQTKVENAGRIAFDLFRLCLFVQEERSKVRNNGRYLVVVFNRRPQDYLAFRRQKSGFRDRIWLTRLLQPGDNEIDIALDDEPPSFKKTFGAQFVEHHPNLCFHLMVTTRVFSPIESHLKYLYWGYLVRVVDFKISVGNELLIYKDTSGESWSQQQQETQKRLIEKVIGL